jgi:orotate phosphoribosyltransferase
MSDREQLATMLRTRSVRHGQFTLVSGQTSEWYIDAKLTTCTARAMPLVGRLFLDKMSERGWAPDAVGGLTMGADAIAGAIARQSLERGMEVDSFVIRKETKQHGTKRFLEGMIDPAGKAVVILDDVCTTGGSTILAIERARESGLIVIGAICLVDREMGAEANIQDRLQCPFDRVFRFGEIVDTRPHVV